MRVVAIAIDKLELIWCDRDGVPPFPMAIANSPDWPLTQNASWGFWDKPSKRGILLR